MLYNQLTRTYPESESTADVLLLRSNLTIRPKTLYYNYYCAVLHDFIRFNYLREFKI